VSAPCGEGSRNINRKNIITYFFVPPKTFEKSILGNEVRRNEIPVLAFAPKTQLLMNELLSRPINHLIFNEHFELRAILTYETLILK